MSSRRVSIPREHPEVTGVRQLQAAALALLEPPPPSAPGADAFRSVPGTRPPLPLRDLFKLRLDTIRRAYMGTPEQAVFVCAFDPQRGIAASARLLAPDDGTPAHLVLGRHERCDLRLTDPTLSLRHAALVVRRLPTSDLRVRLIDLRSGLGLVGEDGRPMESVSVEGHLFVGLGRYVILVLLGGEDLSFSDDGGEVYDALPPRVFFDARERIPGSSGPRRPRLVEPADEWAGMSFCSGTLTRARQRGISEPRSRVDLHRAPEPLAQAGLLEGDRLGTLGVSCAAGDASVPLYDAQARDGVLLGRYERCESADLPFELPDTVSRVHALVLREGDGLYVLDTASTFGLRNGADVETRAVNVKTETTWKLGDATTIKFTPER